jgi:uncharacterized membrane protein
VSKARLEAFCDGVFAIAATLLILHVSADGRGAALAGALTRAWPQYAAYLLSFVMIGIWWVNHHAYLSVIDRVDRTFLFANLALLICIAFLPFPTQLVAEHLRDPGRRAAAFLYCLTLTAAAVSMAFLWRHASRRRRLIAAATTDAQVRRHTRDVALGPPANAATALLSLWSAEVALGFVALFALFYVVGGGALTRRTTA